MSKIPDIDLSKFGLNLNSAKKEFVINEKSPISAFDLFKSLPYSVFLKLIQKAINIGAGALKDNIKDKVKRALPASTKRAG